MKGESKIRSGFVQSRRELNKKLSGLLLFLRQNDLRPFPAVLRHATKTVFAFGLGLSLALLTACATSAKVTPQPVTTVENQGPSVARLEDGRQGFVIRENPTMDAGLRDEFERAVALMNGGENEKAIDLLSKVIERSPGVTAPYINIAVAYMRTGKNEPAEKHLKTALALVPNHPLASNEYGLLLRKAGRFMEARDIYEKAITDFPDYLPIRRNLGILCDLYLNDPECALKQFEIYSEGKPADAQVKIWIAELRMRLKR